jgi:hypothetical protein
MSGKKRHVRDGDRLDDDATIVIRGGVLDPATLRADTLRYHDIYGEYGISVFATRDTTVDELAQSVPLVRFETLTLVRVGVLRAAGFRLDPTGRNPQHFTVAFAELNRGVEALVSCEHLNLMNPYHED